MPHDPRNDTFFRRLIHLGHRVWLGVQPAPKARNAARWTIVALATSILHILSPMPQFGFGPALDRAASIGLSILIAGVSGVLLLWMVKLIHALPKFVGTSGLIVVGGLIVLLKLFEIGNRITFGIAGVVLLGEALFVGTVFHIWRGGLRGAGKFKWAFVLTVLVVGIWANNRAWQWLNSRGYDPMPVTVAEDTSYPAPLDLPDPGAPGGFAYDTLTYGSGTDVRRPEFGKDAAIVTGTVDGTDFTEAESGWNDVVRRWFWGFDLEHMPINGRVWAPMGDGPFPLVLCVHGNHSMEDFSDSGYAYLGEQLASRGFLFVSVDENFLNSSWSGGLDTENDARGWILLKHLETWRAWNNDASSRFHGKVDLGNVALIGHSRGGEAVAVAAAFNRLDYYPDDATVPFDFHFGIKTVIAIAPVDGQYSPSGRLTPLENLNYLVLHGAHDGDVTTFHGDRTYHRIAFSDENYWIKSSLYIHRANHGQFNSGWGDADAGEVFSAYLNRKPLLAPEDQRRIARVYIGAFIEATLAGKTNYIPMFRDYRLAKAWLPEDHYISAFQDSTFEPIATFDEDIDVTTASSGGGIRGDRLAVWKERDLPMRKDGSKRNQAVYVGWRKGDEAAAYEIELTPDVRPTSSSLLVFGIARYDEEVPEPDVEEDGETKDDSKNSPKDEDAKPEKDSGDDAPLEFDIELHLEDGATLSIPFSKIRPVPPILNVRLTRLWYEEDWTGKSWEPTLQTVEIPMELFKEAGASFDPAQVQAIRLVFNGCSEGVLIFDGFGFATPYDSRATGDE